MAPLKGSVPFPHNKDHSKLPTITQRSCSDRKRQTGMYLQDIVHIELLEFIATFHHESKIRACQTI